MATKSPLAKALKGNQGKLPQALQDAIKAAPESPAKQTIGPKVNKALTPKPSAVVESAKPTTGKKEVKNPLSGKPVKQYKAAMVHPPKPEKKVSLPAPKFATKTRVKKIKGDGK